MGNKKGNGVKGKYMENIDYTIKNIDKLEELKGYEWEYKNAEFILEFDGSEYLLLTQKNGICSNGKIESLGMRVISLLNLSELEFYGLKVILNEKPKLTRKAREFLEMFDTDFISIATDKNCLYPRLFSDMPICGSSQWYFCEDGNEDYGIPLKNGLFPFITWESGKAWSKAELMELEVQE